MSAGRRGKRSAVDPAISLGSAGTIEHALELVLAGLAADEDELLGELAEGRAGVASARGDRAARRWWLSQALRAVPRLAWYGLVHRPVTPLLGLAGFVLWAWLASLGTWLASLGTPRGSLSAQAQAFPSAGQVIRETVLVGVWNLLAAVIVGAGITALARRIRLIPALVAAALMALLSTQEPFYIVYGPGTCTMSGDGQVVTESCSLELGAWSSDVIVPVLWQLPTMIVLLPLSTTVGGLAVVAWTRRHRTRASEQPTNGQATA